MPQQRVFVRVARAIPVASGATENAAQRDLKALGERTVIAGQHAQRARKRVRVGKPALPGNAHGEPFIMWKIGIMPQDGI